MHCPDALLAHKSGGTTTPTAPDERAGLIEEATEDRPVGCTDAQMALDHEDNGTAGTCLLHQEDTSTQLQRALSTPATAVRSGDEVDMRTPTPGEAARRLRKFTDEVERQRTPPLITLPPKQKLAVKTSMPPLRSRRIVAQQWGHIPTAKRGEVLIMKRMGILPPQAPPTAAARRSYDALFHSNLLEDVEAFDVMLPAVTRRVGRASRQPMAATA